MRVALKRRESLPVQIIKILKKEIFDGTYQPGDSLPPERELAFRFGTSRVTIRKALGALELEGWIEVVQGSGNIVADFKKTVGMDVLPSLMLTFPERFIVPEVFSTIISYTFWMYQEILLSATVNADPDDEPVLRELLSRQIEGISPEEFWRNEQAFYGEMLRIGGNIVLQMSFASFIKLILQLLELGVLPHPPYPHELYHAINHSLIVAVCSGDQSKVKQAMSSYRKDLEDAFQRFVEGLPVMPCPDQE